MDATQHPGRLAWQTRFQLYNTNPKVYKRLKYRSDTYTELQPGHYLPLIPQDGIAPLC